MAIESSCDETAAAVIRSSNSNEKTFDLLSNVIATQSVHQKYGGVVPELASRAHQQYIVPVVKEALQVANVTKSMLNAIAFTQGPGLLGSLLVGSSFAKSLAFALDIPLVGVHHMKAHILAHFIEPPYPKFPFLCLTVSGGHTQIVIVRDYLEMEVIGQTLDDAAGEAFDKAAKLLGLPYPGGPLIDQMAQLGNAAAFAFPETNIPGLDYSFSGIKTAFMNFLKNNEQKNPDFAKDHLPDICASIQHTLVNMLVGKLEQAIDQTNITEVAIAGGVSANSGLRKVLQTNASNYGWNLYIPKLAYCTDNAAMIAAAGFFQYIMGKRATLAVSPQPRMPFRES